MSGVPGSVCDVCGYEVGGWVVWSLWYLECCGLRVPGVGSAVLWQGGRSGVRDDGKGAEERDSLAFVVTVIGGVGEDPAPEDAL